ncbi:Smr/MutS family protein [Rhodoplanes roseus]|uniref:Smr domain-containing protein n=1 Tax=Rhodoplanes roseus TaxID=29409 RepID=A0A327L0S9_9BRAD|nr:Smr/MutS family protein [Rhodoplanes roseus]RAI44061.1 hypothetical protein CH341_11040 [Rhodoplanes roseus]
MVRKLSDDEHRLWSGVIRSVRPMHPARASVTPLPAAPAAPTPATEARPAATARQKVRHTAPPEPKAPPLAPIGRRDTRRLVRGHTDIDARIDLHGMTQAEAHAALRAFVWRAQGSGARYVLVITGKGGEGDGLGRGVLRRQVPLWLQLPEFRTCVAGFDAAVGHGGAGALYVRIRRPR